VKVHFRHAKPGAKQALPQRFAMRGRRAGRGSILQGMASMESLCLEIRSALLERRQRLAEEIGRHPRPITACDVHFNRLLEERAAASAALDRFDEFVAALRG
jgi:hypothetical protein